MKEERHKFILDEVTKNHKAHSAELSKLLAVSEDTIRRDLNELASSGYLKKVHGGAISSPYLMPSTLENISFESERSIIGKKAASLIKEGQVILIEGEETALFIVEALVTDIMLTVVTNSLTVASSLCSYLNIETIFLGGKISKKSKITVGLDVVNTLSEIHVDFAFIENVCLHAKNGISEKDREQALIKRAMINAADHTVACCLMESIEVIEPFRIGDISSISTIASEIDPLASELSGFRKLGIDII